MSAECKSVNSDHNQRANDESFIDPVEHFTFKFESLCPEILIPDTEEGMIQLVVLVRRFGFLDYLQERLAIASACYAAVYYMGPTLRKLVQDFIPHKLLPITSILQAFYRIDTEPKFYEDSFEIGVHLALMFLVSIANLDVKKQALNYNSLAGDADLPTFNPDWEIPLSINNALSHIFESYPAFVAALVRQFLISDIETLSTFEKALKDQVKPILSQIGRSDFHLYHNIIREIINSPLIEIKEIQEEMDKPFYEACIFFRKQLDVEKPFVRLLNLSSSSVLDSKNFPFIHYAAKCIRYYDEHENFLELNEKGVNLPSTVCDEIEKAVVSRKKKFRFCWFN